MNRCECLLALYVHHCEGGDVSSFVEEEKRAVLTNAAATTAMDGARDHVIEYFSNLKLISFQDLGPDAPKRAPVDRVQVL